MRIAYISLHWPRRKDSGIGRKIEEQMAVWRKRGHTVHFFSHRPPVANPGDLVNGTSFEYLNQPGFTGKILTEINRCRTIFPMMAAVKQYAPDLIYLRWGMFVFPSQKLFDIAPVVMEINTNDVSQHVMLGKLYSTYNRFTRGIYLKKSSALVFTSFELMNDSSFAAYKRPGIVIANGIDLETNLPAPAPRNPRPRIGFIGTPDMPWQGVDKLFRLAELCPELDIDIVGFKSDPVQSIKPANLFLHGYLDRAESRNILARVDVGMGTLALHRKNMEEASPLKTREYLAYGIPIVLPYMDTDLKGLELDTILRIPNTEENIEQNWNAVKAFAFRMAGKRVERNLITDHIDSTRKEDVRLEFFQKHTRLGQIS